MQRRINPLLPILLVLTVVNAVWWLLLQLSSDHETIWNYAFNLAYGVSYGLAGGFAILHAVRLRRRGLPIAIGFNYIGVGLLCNAVAQGIWFYYNLVLTETSPSLSVADFFYVLGSSLQLIGVGSLLLRTLSKRPFNGTRAMIVSLAIGFGLLAVTILLFQFQRTDDIVHAVFTAFYGVSSTLLAVLLLIALLQQRRRVLFPCLLVFFAGAAFTALGDMVFAVRDGFDLYWNGDYSDGLFAAGALCFFAAMAVLAPNRENTEEQDENRMHWRTLAIVLFVFVTGSIITARFAEEIYVTDVEAAQHDITIHLELGARSVGRRLYETSLQTQTLVDALVGLPRDARGEAFHAEASLLAAATRQPGFFILLDASGRTVETVGNESVVDPFGVGQGSAGDQVWSDALLESLRAGGSVVSEPIALPSGDPAVVLLSPIRLDGVTDGFVATVDPLPHVLETLGDIFTNDQASAFVSTPSRVIAIDGSAVYDRDARTLLLGHVTLSGIHPADILDGRRETALAQSRPVSVGPDEWILYAAPSVQRLSVARTKGLLAFSGAGVLMVLITISTYLFVGQESRMRRELADRTRELDQRVRELSRFKFFLEHVSDAVLVTDPRWRIGYANQEALRQSGFARDELSGRDVRTLLRAEDRRLARSLAEAYEKRRPWTGNALLMIKDADPQEVLLSIRHLQPEEGEDAAVTIIVWRDVTRERTVERAKSQFVSFVAHQLRAPMAQMRWNIEVLLEKRLSAGLRRDLEELHAQILIENRFVSDLLNVSRIERGMLKLTITKVPVVGIIKDAFAPLMIAAHERDVAVQVRNRYPRATVYVDAEKATEALRNVLDNAIKYTASHTKVEVEVREERDAVVIHVRDHGPGIPDEVREHLFDIKVGDMQVLGGSSAGIGLYLSHKFLQAMGGSIGYQTFFDGSEFFLRLPKARKAR